jgi:hypothetical protein
MSMGRDYVSELRQATGLLIILQVIYEHGKPWRNDFDKEKLIRPLECSLAILHLVQNQEDPGKGNDGFCLRNICLILVEFCSMRKILPYEISGFTSPPKKGVLRIFIALKNYFVGRI